MQTLVIYDIEKDRIRNKILNACKDYGLEHIQYSAFLGNLNHNRREELWERLRRVLGKNHGKILMIPICDKDFRLIKDLYVGPEGMFGDES